MELRLNLFIILISTTFLFGCKSSSSLSEKESAEKIRVEQCRKSWNYDSLQNETSIKVLFQDKKGRYDLVTWPNFFIGIDLVGDTIGIIEYDTELEFKKGRLVTFLPAKRKSSISEILDSEMDEPVFRVRKKASENDLYCAVSMIYYGKLKE